MEMECEEDVIDKWLPELDRGDSDLSSSDDESDDDDGDDGYDSSEIDNELLPPVEEAEVDSDDGEDVAAEKEEDKAAYESGCRFRLQPNRVDGCQSLTLMNIISYHKQDRRKNKKGNNFCRCLLKECRDNVFNLSPIASFIEAIRNYANREFSASHIAYREFLKEYLQGLLINFFVFDKTYMIILFYQLAQKLVGSTG